MDKVYSDKQIALLQLWRNNKLRRINLLEGSVRSGKTWISLVLWAFWVATMPADKNYLMVAKTLTSLRRNCLDLLETLVGTMHFTYSLSKKEGELFGRRVYLEGVNDARAESKIRGMTLQGAYCDELTLFTEDFFNMLLSRLSEQDAKLISTTNPDSPQHWLMQNYILRQNKLDMFVMKFLIDDNPYLNQEYVKQLKTEYTGVFYKRFILGEWVLAEGLVYPMFSTKKNVVQEVPENGDYYISVDYGTVNPCAMLLWSVNNRNKTATCIEEYYYDSRARKKQRTDEEHYTALEELAGERHIQNVVVDPSAASFIEVIRRHGRYPVQKAKNDVLDGIRLTGSLMEAGHIKIHQSCKNFIQELQSYCWDNNSTEDRVIKDMDHACDSARYLFYTLFRHGFPYQGRLEI